MDGVRSDDSIVRMATSHPAPLVIAIAGGTGSGKTTVAREIERRLPGEPVRLISHDAYYRDRPDLSLEERAAINYDHPDAFETELLIEHIRSLRGGRSVEVPTYNYATHSRNAERVVVEPGRVIIVEGILVLADRALAMMMDIKVFVDVDADLRFIRRLERDTRERGRNQDSVVQQYLSTVRRMHLEFCEPSKRRADIIIPRGGHNEVAIDILASKVKSILTGMR